MNLGHINIAPDYLSYCLIVEEYFTAVRLRVNNEYSFLQQMQYIIELFFVLVHALPHFEVLPIDYFFFPNQANLQRKAKRKMHEYISRYVVQSKVQRPDPEIKNVV